jgi:hypothetical protein
MGESTRSVIALGCHPWWVRAYAAPRPTLATVTDPTADVPRPDEAGLQGGAAGPGARRDWFRDVAAAVCAVEALALVGFCLFYLWELVRGAGDDPARVVMSALLIAVFAVGMGLLARGWWSGRNWPSTPTIVWNLLLLPVAWSLYQADRVGVAVVLAVVAVVGTGSAGAAKTSSEDDSADDGGDDSGDEAAGG